MQEECEGGQGVGDWRGGGVEDQDGGKLGWVGKVGAAEVQTW